MVESGYALNFPYEDHYQLAKHNLIENGQILGSVALNGGSFAPGMSTWWSREAGGDVVVSAVIVATL